MRYRKVTHGWVTQVFEDGRCVEQSFFAGDEVEYEDDVLGEPVPNPYAHSPADEPSQSFEMVQPLEPDRAAK